MNSILVQRFDLRVPVFQAPLGGGPSTAKLVGLTSHAGLMGALGAAYLNPAAIASACAEIRKITARPFSVNLFLPDSRGLAQSDLSAAQIHRAETALRPFHDRLGIAPPALTEPWREDFDAQFEAVIKEKPAVFSFVFGLLDRARIQRCHDAGIFVIGTATDVDEAMALEKTGIDAVLAQGHEAGGHRGFTVAREAPPTSAQSLSTEALVRSLKPVMKIPVIAAGGIMTGQEAYKICQLGADAAALGSAFLLCEESGCSAAYRQALADARAQGQRTLLTRAFSGRWARALENEFLREISANPEVILPFPAQNRLCREMRQGAAQAGDANLLSLWAGTGIARLRALPVTQLANALIGEWQECEKTAR